MLTRVSWPLAEARKEQGFEVTRARVWVSSQPLPSRTHLGRLSGVFETGNCLLTCRVGPIPACGEDQVTASAMAHA